MLVQFTSNAAVTNNGFVAVETFVAPTCSGTRVITVSGVPISDGPGPYTANMNCSWNITAPTDNTIRLNFTSFASEANADILLIYDVTTDPYLLANFSGFSLPPTVQSLGRSLLLVWTTDSVNQFAGFDALVTFDPIPSCSGLTNITTAGTILSDGAGSYGFSASCTWLVTAPVGFFVRITFLTFTTEASFDYVYINDGTSTGSTLLAQLSGSTIPPSYRSSGRNLLVRFTSDTVNNFAGFTAAVTFQPYQCNGTTAITTDGAQFSSSTGPYLNNVAW